MATKYFIAPNVWGIFCGMDKTTRIDSRTVAEVFGKRHDNVLRDIENLDCSPEFRHLNFEESSYKNSQNKKQPYYTMTRKGFTHLDSRYIKEEYAQIRKEFFKRFDEMEALVNDKLKEESA